MGRTTDTGGDQLHRFWSESWGVCAGLYGYMTVQDFSTDPETRWPASQTGTMRCTPRIPGPSATA